MSVVVDSPLPTDDPELGQETAAAGETGSLDAQVVDTDADQGAADSPSPEQQEITNLSTVYGLDLSGFSSPADARAAARLLAEQYAQAGLAISQELSYLPPVPKPEAPTSQFDEVLADPTLDPAIKQKLAAAKQQYDQQLQAYDAAIQQQQTRFQETRQAEVRSRAGVALDKFASPKYGVAGARTVSQQIATQNVFKVAEAIIDGMVQRGARIPPIEAVVQMAVDLDGGAASAQKTSDAAKALGQKSRATSNAVTLGPKSRVNKPYDPLGVLNDDSFRAGLRAIAARNR